MSFYMTYLARWPDYFHVAEAPGNRIMGYSELSFFIVLSFFCFFSSLLDWLDGETHWENGVLFILVINLNLNWESLFVCSFL